MRVLVNRIEGETESLTLNSLDRNASLYRRYVADLEAQEGELDGLGDQLADLRADQAAAQQALARRLGRELFG